MADIKSLLVKCGAVKFGKFTLTSGKQSEYYIDVKFATSDPEILHEIGVEIAGEAHGFDYVAGMELGAVPIVTAVSLATGLPSLIIRKKAKEHGTGSRIEGPFSPGKKVLLVEDVTTTGGSTLEAANVLRGAGLEVSRCVVVVDRESGAVANLSKEGVELSALVRVSELLEARK
ncbi:MAG: orotate phosphoribosyltransferase [Euryarchaeota archaeon]|nr:orotate phosphoribosyltransferase [Euryarchaeota archaeon]